MNLSLIIYFLALSGGFLLTAVLTPLLIRLALKFGIIDQPNLPRKIHEKAVPLLGGLAIFFPVFFLIFLFRYLGLADFSLIPDNYLWGVFIGALLLMIGGFLDDKYNLKPKLQIVWPILAALAVVFSGIKIGFVSNPVGGPANSILYLAPWIGMIIAFFWLMGMMYTTKFLDGLDGLVSGIAVIASLAVFLLSLDFDIRMSATGVWALILAGSALGFLVFNWHPAKVFLGEGGSLFFGFMLGALSIISGSKIFTTLLVVGIPILDVFWVIAWRLARRESPFSHADRKHLHFRLLDLGFSQKGAVLFLYLISLLFGFLAIFSRSYGKMISLLVLFILMTALTLLIYFISRKNVLAEK